MLHRYLRFFRPDIKTEVDDELSFHIDAKVEELVARGWTREAARLEAKKRFGDFETVQQVCRQLGTENEKRAQRAEYFLGWRQDIVYGLRQLLARWPTSLLAILMLGIGIGAVAAVFSIVNAVILRPLPFPHPDRIVTLSSTRQGRDDEVTPRNFMSWKEGARSFTEVGALEPATITLSDAGNAEQIPAGPVTANFFSVFGVQPMLGRTFTLEEDRPPRRHLVVLSHRLWMERFASDPNVLGRQIRLNRELYTVIGVMPASFDLRVDAEQLWIPLALTSQQMNWKGGVFQVFARLRPEATLTQARAEMSVMSKVLRDRYPDMNRGLDIRVGDFSADLVGDYRQQLLVLLAAVGSVLLIACANVANLLLARGAGRGRELTIRAALGATRSRIIRQLITESLLLGLAGAAFGLIVTDASLRAMKSLGASDVPRLNEAGVDATLLLVVLGLAFGCTLLFGMMPALRSSRFNLQSALGQGGRSSQGLSRDRTRNAYIAVQACLALVLLVAAGLLIRTAIAAQNVQPGFNPGNVITGRTALPSTYYRTADQIIAAYSRVQDDLALHPGVLSAALTSKVPLGSGSMGLTIKPDAVNPLLKDQLATELSYVSPAFFATMQIPILSGRAFDTHDCSGSAPVAIVNETLARVLWPGKNPVGQNVRIPELEAGTPNWKVVGVVADVHDDGLMTAPPPVLYISFAQVPLNPWHWTEQSLYLVARTRPHLVAASEILQTALHGIDPELPLGDIRTMDERLSQSLSNARFYALTLTILGLCGFLLTAAGIYGVVGYFVTRQRAEIGIRMALGASRGTVLLYVLRQGMRPVLLGIGLGLAASLAVSRLLASQLFGVGSMDPLTFVLVSCMLLVVAALACLIPAQQASRIDPMSALRSD